MTEGTSTSPKPVLPERPVRVTLLVMVQIIFAVWNGLRLGEAFVFWKTLKEFGAHPGAAYIAASGGFWLVAGLVTAWGMWTGRAWSRWATLGVTAGYIAWYWSDRLFLQIPHANWPFALLITTVFMVFVLIVLFSRRSINFFRKIPELEG